jgi:hypothetical protein
VKTLHVGLERQLHRLRGEIADYNHGRRYGCDCLGLADQDEDVLIVVV